MFDAMKRIAHDKALHYIGGSVAGAVASIVAGMAGMWQQYAAVGAAVILGVGVELYQRRINKRADIKIHDVSGKDALSTALGGVVVGAPSWVPFVLGGV